MPSRYTIRMSRNGWHCVKQSRSSREETNTPLSILSLPGRDQAAIVELYKAYLDTNKSIQPYNCVAGDFISACRRLLFLTHHHSLSLSNHDISLLSLKSLQRCVSIFFFSSLISSLPFPPAPASPRRLLPNPSSCSRNPPIRRDLGPDYETGSSSPSGKSQNPLRSVFRKILVGIARLRPGS